MPQYGILLMPKVPPDFGLDGHSPKTLSERLRALRKMRDRQNRIQDIIDALISSGCKSLDDQAKALGLPRATVWTIRQNKHKLGRLSAKTIERIITNPETPSRVLTAVQKYVENVGASEDEHDNPGGQISIRTGSQN